MLLIVDEVITGFGRTGAWFAIEHFGVEPDIMTMAKAMTAGYMPMGAVITRPEIADALPVFRHVHTFSGHAAAAAAALTVIAIKERDGLIDKAAPRRRSASTSAEGARWSGSRSSARCAASACGMAVDFTSDKPTRAPFADDTVPAIVRRMQDKGVLVCAIGPSAFEMAPPLISTREQTRPRRRASPPKPSTRSPRNADWAEPWPGYRVGATPCGCPGPGHARSDTGAESRRTCIQEPPGGPGPSV